MPLGVLYTINNLKTAGMRNVLADLVRGLDRSRFLPKIAVARKSDSSLEKELEKICEIIEIPLHIPTRPRVSFPSLLAAAVRRLRKMADVAHSFDYASDWTEPLAMRLAGMPWIAEKTNFNWGGLSWWLRALLASKIVCLSQTQRNQLFGRSRFLSKTVVVNTGVDLKKFSPAEYDWKMRKRKKMSISPPGLIICCVADLIPVKGHKDLLRAFAAARENFSCQAYLLLVGSGPPEYEQELRRLSHDLGISNSALFLGRRDDVADILRVSDGLILATRDWGRREALGACLIEAMACGLGVIATRSGGPEDIVIGGETGWLVDAEGPQPLIEPLIEMINDEHKRALFGKAGRQRAKKQFSAEEMVDKYQQLYLGLLSGPDDARNK